MHVKTLISVWSAMYFKMNQHFEKATLTSKI